MNQPKAGSVGSNVIRTRFAMALMLASGTLPPSRGPSHTKFDGHQ